MADKPHYRKKTERGQSMTEYALIVALVIVGFGLALAATGPAIANVFSNTVFNLVSRDRLAVGVTPPSAANFWATMTWVATQTPQEIPLATRTLPPPTVVPTDGPSPTPTPITPTNTPTNTATPTPSPTPQDKSFVAPWTDTANNRVDWRLDQFDVGTENWYADYFPNISLTGSPSSSGYNTGTAIGKIDFNWGTSLPPVAGWTQYDNYSVRWRKGFLVEPGKKTTIQFDIPNVDDGIRIWILGPSTGVDSSGGATGTVPGSCSNRFKPRSSGTIPNPSTPAGTPVSGSTKVTSGGTPDTVGSLTNSPSSANRWSIYDDAYFGYDPTSAATPPTECLVVDRWTTGDSSSRLNIRRTVSEGFYVIQVDYAESTGNAGVTVNVTNSAVSTNPDNTRITSGGAPIAGTNTTAMCDWGNVQNLNNSDSPEFHFKEYVSAAGLPAGNRCYLELRGHVWIPLTAPNASFPLAPINPAMIDPVFTFWDLWDFQAGTNAWVEIADYDSDGDGNFDRESDLDGKWIKIPLHANNTFNYNWTYQTIPLVKTGAGAYDFRGKKVALRFGMENASSTATNRWWVDSLTIDSITRKTFPPARTWDLNDNAQAKDFITSGNWALSTENAIGASGMSWHDSPGRSYSKLYISRNSGTGDQRDFRIHTIEWNGIIDISGSVPDEDGDTGDPILTFYQEYDIGRLVGLEIQYTTDPYSAGDGANWQTVPGGQIIARTKTSASKTTLPEKVTVPLKSIGPTSFRLRFAMLVNKDADTTSGGWWIDEIRLERVDRPRFTNYPFHDPAEDAATFNQWQVLGTWDRADTGYAPPVGENGHSYTDSAGNYPAVAQSTTLELKHPIDFRLDTAQNARASNCSLGPTLCETGGPFPKPVKPFMTFMWKHDFGGGGENVYVEWKRFNDPQTAWSILWTYKDRMATNTASTRSATRTVLDWERVEVNLKPIVTAIATDDTATQQDDDILIRFRFETNTSGEADGMYVDDIRIQEGVEDVWYLWPSTESRTDNTGALIRDASNNPVLGSGNVYQDSLENNPKLFTGGWFYGGGWQAITYTQRDGLYSFHDSGSGQSEPDPDNTTPIIYTAPESFNVLEMNKIIDLRGVAVTERPLMYFWSRWSIRSSNYARVQISYEDPSLGALCSGGFAQCYEHNLGWSEWQTVWEKNNAYNFTWTREQISLEAYAKSATSAGRRIRIRFVLDTLDATADRDGWYIDGIVIRYLTQKSFVINASQSFSDSARDMNNWVGEGLWGLDPEFYRGSGGGPISLLPSTWAAKYWALITSSTNRCTSINADFLTCANRFLSETGTNRHDTVAVSWQQPAVMDLNYQWGTGGPNSNAFKDYFVGRWTLTTQTFTTNPVYTFIVASDDGVRLRMTTNTGVIPPCIGSDDNIPLCGNTWNIINNWTYHGRTVDMGIAKLFAAGAPGQSYSTGKYTFTLEYFEGTGDAGLSLSIGANTFSFSDSPKQGSGLLFPEVPAVKRGNSSLILNGAFDLRTATSPILRFWTRYELGGTARVEVTTDGGFTWTQDGLLGRLANSYYVQPVWAGQYWSGTNYKRLDRNGAAVQKTQDTAEINMDWGGNALLPNWESDNVSVRWRRQINVTTPLPLTFRTEADDGVRLWITSPGDPNSPNTGSGCLTGYSTNPYMRSGDDFRSNTTFTTGCLAIDNWTDQGGGVMYATRTLATGTHWLQLDYYEASGGAKIKLEVYPAGFSSHTWNGTHQPSDLSNWQERINDLSSYVGMPAVGLRFRLDRLGNTGTQTSSQSPINWADGLWIVDVSVANS